MAKLQFEQVSIESVEKALDRVLIAYRDLPPRPPRDVPARSIPMSEIKIIKSREASLADDLAREPTRRALRLAIRKLGKMLFRETGSTDGMRESQERVANMDASRYLARCDLMDRAWDGLGNEKDTWHS